MSNDPLEAVFVTGDKSAALKRTDTARKLATYLERMPVELRSMFAEEFQRINRAELTQLRAELQAEKLRADTLSSAQNVLAAQLEAAQARCAAQAAQLEQAKRVIMAWYIVDRNECGYDIFPDMKALREVDLYESGDPLLPWALGLRTAWLAANAQPQEQSA